MTENDVSRRVFYVGGLIARRNIMAYDLIIFRRDRPPEMAS